MFTDSSCQPNWEHLASVWSGHANGKTIFCKLPEHLKTYYKVWSEFCNEHNSVALNAEATQWICSLVHSTPAGVHVSVPTALLLTIQDSITASPSINIQVHWPGSYEQQPGKEKDSQYQQQPQDHYQLHCIHSTKSFVHQCHPKAKTDL
ncbi:hypothetical protein BKA82DRAFT_4020810 [Pisolithus tinctorius]|nr:hypothetical protein BKA82DRAFT_4020810 [Pisolithus tinctorius]